MRQRVRGVALTLKVLGFQRKERSVWVRVLRERCEILLEGHI